MFSAILAILLIGQTSLCRAQTPIRDASDELRRVFAPCVNPDPSIRFFYDLAAHATDSAYFDHMVLLDTNDVRNWYQLYLEMGLMAYDTTTLVPTDTVFDHAWPHIQNDTFPVGIMDLKFNLLKPDVLDTNLWFDFDTVGNTLSDNPTRTSSPYQPTQNIFAASILNEESEYADPVFMVSPEFIFADPVVGCNTCPKLDGVLKIDFNDGGGWRVFSSDSTSYFRAVYTTAGVKLIRCGLFSSTGTLLKYSKSMFKIAKDVPQLVADSTWTDITGITVSLFGGCAGGGAQKKYVIYLEGIDLVNNRHGGEIYEKMIENESMGQLRNRGYTFLVVDWKNSYKDIKVNAMSVVALIDKLKDRDPNLAPLVVVGESMGGLVGRYALRYMETNDYIAASHQTPNSLKLHNTRLFITIDAPHKGANIPLCYQWMYRYVASATYPSVINPFVLARITKSWKSFLDGKATKQMLLYHTDSDLFGIFPVSSCHYGPAIEKIDFDNDLAALGNGGYPEFCKKVALTNGSWMGDRQRRTWDESYRDPNDHMLRIGYETFVKIRGKKFLGMESTFDMQSEPDGDGDVFNMNANVYRFQIKLKRWRVDIGFFKVVLTGIRKEALDVRPYDVSAGSYTIDPGRTGPDSLVDAIIPSFGHGGFGGPLDIFELSYSGDRGGIRIKASVGVKDFIRIGAGFDAFTDGTSFGFIPTGSSFDYDDFYTKSLDDTLLNYSVSDIMSKTPFDVVVTNPTHLAPGAPSSPRPWVRIGNRNHLFVENSTEDYNDFKSCDSPYARIQSCILNREIGDDSLYLENTQGRIPFTIEAYEGLLVNQKNPHYNYPSMNSLYKKYNHSDTIRKHIILSKEEKYDVLTSSHTFRANDTVDVQGLLPAQYSTIVGAMYPCCNWFPVNYSRLAPPIDSTSINKLNKGIFKLYPNPATNGQNIRVDYSFADEGISRVSVYNMLGQEVLNLLNNCSVKNKIYTFELALNLQSGIYFLRINNGREQHETKFIISQQ
jgi:pimeloyl-ACP methyl ester carboxylesterase